MKRNERKIREELQAFSVPPCDPNQLQKTVFLAEKTYRERLLSKRIGFWKFIAMQVRFIGRWVWLAQAAFLLLFLFLFNRSRVGTVNMQSAFLLLSSFAPLVAFVGFPEIVKSYAHNVEGIEACTRFSMRKLMGARMLILGLADLCSLTIILAVSAAGSTALISRMILYLFVPFNLTCCVCLTILDHVKNRYGGYCCGAVCALCSAAVCRLSLVRNCYEAAATGVWTILFCISILYLAIEIVRVLQSFSRVCFGNEILSAKWE